MIEAIGIHKNYGSLHVLKGIDLIVKQNEIVTIVGASGAGKSTLLHIMGTLDKPDKGRVNIDGTDVFILNDRQLSAFRNKRIGFVFQFHHLLPEFSALENCCLPALIAGESKASAFEKAKSLLTRLGLSDRLKHKPMELSGGEQQRVAVARALINQPAVVLADEPTGNLDSSNANDLHRLFVELRDELGQTFVIITHNHNLADISDRVIEMADGQI